MVCVCVCSLTCKERGSSCIAVIASRHKRTKEEAKNTEVGHGEICTHTLNNI